MILVIKGRCISTADFRISTGMSPSGVTLEPSRLKINSCTKSSGTGWNENFSLALMVLLILSILGWELKISSTSSKVFALLSLSSFSSKPLVITAPLDT